MRKVLSLLVAVVAVVAVSCGDDDAPGEVRVGQSGEPPTEEEVATTTTTEAPAPTTTLPLTVSDVPDVSELDLVWEEDPVVDEATGRVSTGPFTSFLIAAPAPHLMAPEGTFDGLEDDELDEAEAIALAEAPARAAALYLGLEPDDPDVQLLVGPAGGPEAFDVVVVQLVEDDSIRALRWQFRIQLQDLAQVEGTGGALVTGDDGSTGTTDTTDASAGGEDADGEDGEGEEATTTTTEAADDSETTDTTVAAEDGPPHLIPVVFSAERTHQCQVGRGHQDFTVGPCE